MRTCVHCMHVHVHMYACACINVLHGHMCICARILRYVHVYMCAHTCVHMCMHMHLEDILLRYMYVHVHKYARVLCT